MSYVSRLAGKDDVLLFGQNQEKHGLKKDTHYCYQGLFSKLKPCPGRLTLQTERSLLPSLHFF